MSIGSTAAAMVPSKQRAIPLLKRNDLVVKRIEYKGIGSWVIKDPVGLKYHRLQPEQYFVLNQLDGKRHLEELRDLLQEEFPTLHFTLTDIQNLVTDLHQKNLVYSERPGQGASMLKQHLKNKSDKRKQAIKNILYLRLPGWDPERTLQWLYPWVKWLFRPWAVVGVILLVLSSLTLLLVEFDYFRSKLPEFQQFFGWPNLLYMWATLGISKIIHEFGHGISCKHFGGECHEMGVMLLVFSPCLYCDVTDSWMLKNKWKRIMIGAAGMYIEIVISACAIYLWAFSEPGLFNHLCLNVFFVTTVTTVIFNANPLMRYDGYYMMADFLEIPNLRPKADKMLRDKFAWYCLGIESRPDAFMPETGIVWFVLFAIAAAIYRWFILFGITLFLYTVLKPYGLQSIGIAMAVFSMGGILLSMGTNIYKIITEPRVDPMSKPKIAVSLSVLVLVVTAGLMVPLPMKVDAAFLIEPYEVKHVYVTTPGRITELNIAPGDEVQQGDTLLSLANFDMQAKYKNLQNKKAVLEKQRLTFHAIEDLEQEQLAKEKIASIDRDIAESEKMLADLKIRARATGRVVAPVKTPEPKHDASQNRLTQWHGIPLDKRNIGAFLETKTHVASIAPSDRLVAILIIDQADRNDVSVGQEVEIQFEHLPGKNYKGKIEKFSLQEQHYVPPELSNKSGGPLATVAEKDGRERLASPAYQATVLLEEDTDLLKSGMRGQARFSVNTRSAGQWLWRYFRQTFHFRL